MFVQPPILGSGRKQQRGYKQEIDGCYKEQTKEIIINYKTPDETLYHELGHALFLNDKEIKEIIDKYPQPRFYDHEIYETDEKILNEKVADYFVMYKYETNALKTFYPEIHNIFDNKLKIWQM